jgi:hypothetical protein
MLLRQIERPHSLLIIIIYESLSLVVVSTTSGVLGGALRVQEQNLRRHLRITFFIE